MKKKTASIDVHRVFGTNNEWCVEVYYRNKHLFYCFGKVPNDLKDKAIDFVKTQGFTDYKYTFQP